MRLSEITLGSKQHADMIAQAQAQAKMTWAKFKQAIKSSTMSDRDMNAVLAEIDSAFGHREALKQLVTKNAIKELAINAEVDEDELFNLAGV